MAQGRYCWRHDCVLRELAAALEQERKAKRKPRKEGLVFIDFVQAGQKGQSQEGGGPTGLLGSGQWDMLVDLDRKLVFLPKVTASRHLLWSETELQVAMLELTVPWEERVEKAHHLKMSKYTSLQEESVRKGWKTWVMPVEMGCRGFPASSMWRALQMVGLTGQRRRRAMQNMIQATEKASCWLWMRRDEKAWHFGGAD